MSRIQNDAITSSSEFDFRVNLVITIVVSSYLVLSEVLLLWIVDSFAFISMPLARGPRGRKRFGAGRRILSPASFTKSSENRGKTKHKWNQEHSRIYIKKEIHETWKRMKELCLYSTDTAFAQHLLSLEMRRRAR